MTPAVVAGKHVWHRKNCINCHTLLGEGAYYAPGPDENHAAPRRAVSPPVPEGSVTLSTRRNSTAA